MKKFAIPAILVATVMVAGMFAFMPIEQATTVHTTVQATSAQTDTVVQTSAAIPNAAGTTLIDISVDQDFTVEIGQFFATVTVSDVTIEDIEIENGAGAVVETIDFADIVVVVGSQIVYPEDVHEIISLPANWSIVIRGLSAAGTGVIQTMVGVTTQGDAVITVS